MSARQFGQCHDAGVVDQHVHRLPIESRGEVSDGREISDVEEFRCDCVVSSGVSDLGCDVVTGVESTNTKHDGSAGSRQCARGLDSDTGGGASDNGASPGKVDIGKDLGSRQNPKGVSCRVTKLPYRCPWERLCTCGSTITFPVAVPFSTIA